MEALRLILLSCFLIQCYGSTHFHYLKKEEEVTLSCKTCQWEADVNSDNKLDCNSTDSIFTMNSKCPDARHDLCQEIKRNKSTSCEFHVRRGFFACVNAESDSCFMYPFKPSSHHVESFIVAQAEPDIVSGPVMENSVLVSGGESINLTCAFKTKGSYSNKPFAVYWIKTGAQSSTCVYSYHYITFDDIGFDAHCAIDKDLLLRRSNTSRPSLDDSNIHNLKISNATQSDRGQYLCVLMVNKDNQQYWAVITNTTVIVDNPVHTYSFLREYVIAALLMIGVILIVGIEFYRKKSSLFKGPETQAALRTGAEEHGSDIYENTGAEAQREDEF